MDYEEYKKFEDSMYRGIFKGIVIGFMILIIAVISIMAANAQQYNSSISKEWYYKIISGKNFYPAQIEGIDGSKFTGELTRSFDSNIVWFKQDSTKTFTLDETDIKSFTYLVDSFGFPKYVYRDIDLREKKEKIRPVEIVTQGDITLYVYRWVELPEVPWLPFSKAYYSMSMIFFMEKDGGMYDVIDFKTDIVPLIKDKEEVYIEYVRQTTKQKDLPRMLRKATPIIKNSDNYKPFIGIINLYNQTQ